MKTGSYLRVYRQTSAPSLENIPEARKELFHRRDHANGVLFATRGCPGRCDFCTVAVMYRHGLRKRPVAEVAAEYASFKGNVIIFWDDNIAGDMEYAKSLFRAIAPHRKWWSSQASIHAGRDDDFLEAAAHSGCKQLFLGLESISQQSMTEVKRGSTAWRSTCGSLNASMRTGSPCKPESFLDSITTGRRIFKDTIDFLETAGVQNATFNILTPFPGTPLFRKMEAEGRILTRDWRKYNSRDDVVYRPKLMSVAELLAGYQYANRRFYSLQSAARRLSRSPVQLWWTLPLNLAYGYQWRKVH